MIRFRWCGRFAVAAVVCGFIASGTARACSPPLVVQSSAVTFAAVPTFVSPLVVTAQPFVAGQLFVQQVAVHAVAQPVVLQQHVLQQQVIRQQVVRQQVVRQRVQALGATRVVVQSLHCR